MPEALIKGETHFSKSDKQALLEMDLSEFDAVFREGYDTDYLQRELTSLYALFAIGHMVYGATFGRLYFSLDEMEAEADELGIGFHDEIDTAVYENFEMVSFRKRIFPFLLSPVAALLIAGLLISPFRWLVINFAPGLLWMFELGAAAIFLFCFGFIWAFAYFLLIAEEVMYDRDEEMAQEIVRLTAENSYQKVLVACGDTHRDGMSEYLEEEGWETTKQATDSPFGKVLIWQEKIFNAVLSPITTIKTVFSRIKRDIQ